MILEQSLYITYQLSCLYNFILFLYFGSALPCRCLAVGAIHCDICATPYFSPFAPFILFYFLGPRLLLWRLCHVVDFQKHVSQPTLWSVLTEHPRNWRNGMTVLSSYPHSLPTRLDCDWTAHARSVVLLANSRTSHVSLMGGSGTDKKAALCQCCHVNPLHLLFSLHGKTLTSHFLLAFTARETTGFCIAFPGLSN